MPTLTPRLLLVLNKHPNVKETLVMLLYAGVLFGTLCILHDRCIKYHSNRDKYLCMTGE